MTIRRVHIEDYGDAVYAMPPDATDIGDRLGVATKLEPGGMYRWKTTVGDTYRLHETKTKAKLDLKTRAQIALQAVGS